MKNLLPILCVCLLASCEQQAPSETQTPVSDTSAFANPPKWAEEVVWYQIFVERFRNGDPSNDPTPEDMTGTYPGFVPEEWAITPWTQDWFKPDTYFAALEGKTDADGNPLVHFGQKAQLRRYGGDLQGVLDKIDYLDSLGVSAVYFNPVNDAPSLHKFDARHWRHIDRNFGPNPKKDVETMAQENPEDPATWQFTEADKLFLQVVETLHKHGIKVIVDYSWNHTGNQFWAWKDILEKQAQSKYADWYWVNAFDDPNTPENEFDFQGWAGVKGLPEIRETNKSEHEGAIRAFEGNIASEAVKQHIFAVTKRWLDPNGDGDPSDGIDGYRLDVAGEVPLGFWRDFRKVVRDANPEAVLIGELWWESWPETLTDPEPFLRGDVFDAPMNYRWYRAARHFFNASPEELPASEFVGQLNALSANIRKSNNYAMMNLTSSHDAPRTLTSLFNKGRYKYNTNPAPDAPYKIDKPDAETYQTLRMLLVHQFSYVGAPHIWAGDEMGMWGSDDPNTRKPLIWPDYQFEDETTHPLGWERPRNEVAFDQALFSFYKKLIDLRTANPVLMHGDLEFIRVDDATQTLAYSRFDGNSEVLAVFNTSKQAQTFSLPVKTESSYQDVLGNALNNQENKTVQITLPARSSALLVSGK
ncbi:MAG: glycoside hydrolase family 13 protein [Saprospiraceae bacterium]